MKEITTNEILISINCQLKRIADQLEEMNKRHCCKEDSEIEKLKKHIKKWNKKHEDDKHERDK